MSLPFPIDGRPYGSDKAERDAERQRVAEFMLAEAQRQIDVAGRSSKCAGYLRPRPEHADGFGGCRNDGSTCHDLPSRAQPEETQRTGHAFNDAWNEAVERGQIVGESPFADREAPPC